MHSSNAFTILYTSARPFLQLHYLKIQTKLRICASVKSLDASSILFLLNTNSVSIVLLNPKMLNAFPSVTFLIHSTVQEQLSSYAVKALIYFRFLFLFYF